MSPADTADYIAHHTKIAGRSDALFADDAITLIHNASRGHPPRSQQPRPARPDRRVRRRAFHRRGESRTHRHQRNSNRLNQIHVTTATTTPPRQGSRHRDHQRPARHKRAGRSHQCIIINADDADIFIVSDGQQTAQATER
ncbi:hypothetical protein MTY81_00290 [Mycolicibacterium sp. TY81]|nr:hypothetical protein MTY81_00290 [Mycolicibacterium sp. TY81]